MKNYLSTLQKAIESTSWGTLGFSLLVGSLTFYGGFSALAALVQHFQGEPRSPIVTPELDIAKPIPTIEEPTPLIEEPTPNPFSETRFPMASCGEALPDSDSEYPVNFYPVFIDHSEANLEKVKTQFCQDSFAKHRDNNKFSIQTSSFVDRTKAKDFANFLSKTFGSAEVGQPTVISSNPNSTLAKSSPSPSSTPESQNSAPPSREGFSNLTLNCDRESQNTQVFQQLEIECYKDQFGKGRIQLDNYGRDWYEVITSQGEILKSTLVDFAPRGDSYILVSPAGSVLENLHEIKGNELELSIKKMTRSQASKSIVVQCDTEPLKIWGIHLTPECSPAGINIKYASATLTNMKLDFGGDNPLFFKPATFALKSGYLRSPSRQITLTFTPYD